tara:strand:- start:1186 stop:2523 length:1338 start_codon:yes stop_codon:yes gene_type:complete
MSKLFDKIQSNIEKKILFSRGDKLLLACSGGSDSTLLAYFLKKHKYDFAIAHVNYGLRGDDSFKDEAFIKELAKRLGIHMFLKQVKIDKSETKLNIQERARNIRYDWFHQIMKEHNYAFTLLGHHADDQIESVLLNLIRGSGIKGLKGMVAKRDRYVRPLLGFWKEEIIECLKLQNIEFRVDKSNEKTNYKRNLIRLNIIPEMEQVNPGFKNNMLRSLKNIELDYTYLNNKIKYDIDCLEVSKKQNRVCYDRFKLKKHKYLNLLIHYLVHPLGFNTNQEEIIMKSILSDSHGQCISNKYFWIGIGRREIAIIKKDKKHTPIELNFNGNSSVQLGDYIFNLMNYDEWNKDYDHKSFLLDFDELSHPIFIRKRQNGDYFYPLGLNKKKKLKRFFIDKKLEKWHKESAIILQSGVKIAAVLDHQIDHRFRITKNTKRILKIVKILESE